MFRLRAKFLFLALLFIFLSSNAWAKLPEFTELAEKAGPAVVNISTVKMVETSRNLKHFFNPFQEKGGPFEDFFDKFFDQMPEKRKQNALGSGFIISEDGYIVSNYHVIAKAEKIKVVLKGGKESYPAEVVGTDPETDLALLKIDANKDLPTLEFGNSDELQSGEWVVAIGNPFGLDHTITAGIISAKGRVIGAGPYDNFLQTDASINPGNSGGPLLNLDGEVVGINTAIVASGQGIGFAIPSNMAKNVISQLKEYKKVKRGWLGVSIQDVSENIAKALDMKETRGALVASVQPGDPADKAGIKTGDVILQVNDEKIDNARDLTRTIGKMKPGDKVDITLWRKGEVKSVEVVLGDRGKQDLYAQKEEPSEQGRLLGMNLRPVTEKEARALELESTHGLLVTDVQSDSKAAEAKIRPGDVILEANGNAVNSVEEFEKILQEDAQEKGVLMLLVQRKGRSLFLTIPM